MAKTLRVRTRAGWTTKDPADTEGNKLSHAELDQTLLDLEAEIDADTDAAVASFALEIGTARMNHLGHALGGTWLPIDGREVDAVAYPTLAGYLGTSSTWVQQTVGSQPNFTAYDCHFSPDSTLCAVAHGGGNRLLVFDTSTWETVAGAPSPAADSVRCRFSPDGSMLAVATEASPFLAVYDTSDWSQVSGTPTLLHEPECMEFSPDSSQLAIGYPQDLEAPGDPNFEVYDTSTWSSDGGVPTFDYVVRDIAWTPDGTQVALAVLRDSTSNHVHIYNSSDWSEDTSRPSVPTNCYGLSYTSDGTYLVFVTGSSGAAVKKQDVSTWTDQITTSVQSVSFFTSLALSSDDGHVAVTAWDNTAAHTIQVFDLSDGARVDEETDPGDASWGCAWSPDGAWLAVTSEGTENRLMVFEPFVYTNPLLPDATSLNIHPYYEWQVLADTP